MLRQRLIGRRLGDLQIGRRELLRARLSRAVEGSPQGLGLADRGLRVHRNEEPAARPARGQKDEGREKELRESPPGDPRDLRDDPHHHDR